MYDLGTTIGYCLVPLLFCLAAFLRAGKGKNPWIIFACGAGITVLAVLGSFLNNDFGMTQILSLIIVAVFGGLIAAKKQ